MPHLDKDLDVVVTDDDQCPSCQAPSPAGLYCPSCASAISASAGPRTSSLTGLDPLTQKLVRGATVDDPRALARAELARRELARRKMLAFTMRLMPAFAPGWFHADLAARLDRFLQRVKDGKSPRLILSVPPRHGKSIEASQYFPAYALGHDPSLEVITTSHTLSLSIDFSRKSRSLLADPMYSQLFPETRLDPDNKNAAGWKTTAGGGYFPAGVGGAIVGRGAHILIIDDPVKNAEQALSATVRENIWSWFATTAYTRLAPGGGVLIIMQRWHLDDLAGRAIRAMVEDDGEEYEIVQYPAIAEHDEWRTPTGLVLDHEVPGATLLRKAGGALHPERWPLERLEAIRNTLSPYEWSALYQQRPSAGDNAVFMSEMMRYYTPDQLPKNLVYYAVWDLALGQEEHHDWTVCLVVGVDEYDNIWLIDLERDRIDTFEMVERILATHTKYGTSADGVEEGHIRKSIGPFMEKRISETGSDSNILPLPTRNRDKVARSRAIQGRMRQGKVFIPQDAAWVPGFVRELLSFPLGQHDDQVDVLSWIGLMLEEMDLPRSPRVKRNTSWRDKLTSRGAGGRNKSWLTA